MSNKLITLAALGSFAAMGPIWADDGAASLAAGSITFTKNTQIRMASEDLYISPVQVRVRFEFANDTERDVDALVAFPLPDVDMSKFAAGPEMLGTTTSDPVNFIGFKLTVNGAPIDFTVEQRAVLNGRDITALVKRAGLPINMLGKEQLDGNIPQIEQLSSAQTKRLVAAGALDRGYPVWTMHTRFYWTQHFPAHRITVIEHLYQPVSGSWNSTSYFTGDAGEEYCVDAPTKVAITSLITREDKHGRRPQSRATNTNYILMTARTWNGPIGRFHMTLDKVKSSNLLSLCWSGDLKRTGPTTFEFTGDNYTPTRDVHMLVME
ncbi:MAG: DUF4424 family protein [Rhizomicrobium sp.]